MAERIDLARLVSSMAANAGTTPRASTGARVPSVLPSAGRAAAAPQFDYSRAYGRRTAPSGGPSALGQVGRGLLGFLRTVDKPRAAVASTIKELQDAAQGEGFSWDELQQQVGRNIGFQEVLEDSGMAGGWQRSALGFIGDIGTDPLTYFTLGTAPAAKAAARAAARNAARSVDQIAAAGALDTAVRAGSSKMISDALVGSARASGLYDDAAGVFADPALERLVVSAAERGRGALTPRGLARAGVTQDLAEQLDLPSLAKRFGTRNVNVELPGSGRLAERGEDIKGGLKRSFRLKPGAKVLRSKFIPEASGLRDTTQRIYDQLLPMGDRAAAVVARSAVNTSKIAARKWGADTAHRVTSALRALWYDMDDDTARAATNNIELGVSGPAEDALRTEYRRMLTEQQAAGVDIADLGENYMPHMVTPEFNDLTRKNADAARWATENLRTKEGIQKTRTLRAGDSFYDEQFGGVPLQEGTIAEINERARVVFGVKLFEDDARDIIPRYIQQATEAIQRAEQINVLQRLGIATDVAQNVVREANKDPKYVSRVARLQKKQAAALRRASERTGRAAQIRRDNIISGTKALNQRKQTLLSQIKQLEDEIKAAGRVVTTAQNKVDEIGRKMGVLETARKTARSQVRAARGEQRTVLRRQLKDLDKQIGEAQSELVKAEAELAERIRLGRSIKVAEPSRDAKLRRIERLNAKVDQTNQQINALRFEATEPGLGSTLPDRQIARADAQLNTLLLKQVEAVDAADAAASAYSMVLGQNRWAVDQLQRVIAELDRGIAAGVNLGPTNVTFRIKDHRAMDLKQRMDTVLEVLRRSDPQDKQTLLFAKFEAAAAASDVAAAKARKDAQIFEGMLKALEDQRFIEKVIPQVANGMVAIGRDLQIPGWLDEALTVKRIADKAPEISRYMRKFYNLFKGYAILRPGFHVRNAYSAMFNMYLEAGAGSFKSAQEFFKFFELVERNPGNYMDAAIKRFGPEKAAMLENAWAATAGSGSGQIAGELTSTAYRRGSRYNPASEEFVLLQKSREIGEWIENRVRGAHAYDVLRRGGTPEQALDVLNKWQFNYTDLTTFDQYAKLVNPFWVFFSRNIALQSQEWVRSAARLSRSIENFRRNVGYGEDEDPNMPEWFGEMGAIRVGAGSAGPLYFFPDLPAGVWPGEIDKLTDPSEVGRLIGETGPWISVPFELMSGRQAFSGIPIPDEYAPLPSPLRQIPGISGLPFVEQGAEGPMMMAGTRSAIMSLIPGLGQVERLFPAGGTSAAERQGYQALAYFTGIGLRENTPRSQQGEQYRRMLEEAAAERRRESLGL